MAYPCNLFPILEKHGITGEVHNVFLGPVHLSDGPQDRLETANNIQLIAMLHVQSTCLSSSQDFLHSLFAW